MGEHDERLIEAAEERWKAGWEAGPNRLRWTSLPPQAGDPAPDASLPAHDGQEVRLSSLWADRPLLILFWRHFGCWCGMDRAGRLRGKSAAYREAGGDVVIVGQGEPTRAANYRDRQQLDVPILCDPERSAYQAFGLLQGTTAQILFDASDPFLRCDLHAGLDLSASRHGTDRALVDDPWQLQGSSWWGRMGSSGTPTGTAGARTIPIRAFTSRSSGKPLAGCRATTWRFGGADHPAAVARPEGVGRAGTTQSRLPGSSARRAVALTTRRRETPSGGARGTRGPPCYHPAILGPSVVFEIMWRVPMELLRPDQQHAAMLTLTEASANDPLLEIVAPDPAQRPKVAPWFFGFPVSYGSRYGRVWANEDASAVAVWIHPESGSMSMPKLLRAGMWQMPLKLGMGGMSRFSKAMAVTEPFHKQVEGPHWYLMNLGTRTARQGQGLARGS